jgi:transposase IS116/IS110/IS902 family protein
MPSRVATSLWRCIGNCKPTSRHWIASWLTPPNGRPLSRLLMTHPGVGPITALATEVYLDDPTRFADGKAVASYVGMIPSEFSSGGKRQRLGELSKQGNAMLRFLWCECGRWRSRCRENTSQGFCVVRTRVLIRYRLAMPESDLAETRVEKPTVL